MNFQQRVFSITFSLLLLFPVIGTAQHKRASQTKPASPGMDMAMMQSPHHKLMMAYLASMTAFASALNEQAMKSQTLDAEAARATVAELRHNLDAMEALHQKHMQMMTPEMQTKMQTMMQDMDKSREMVKEHVTALETAVQAEKPDAAQVRTHATALVNQLQQMSKMHDGKPKKMMSMKM
jgi:glutamate racemase